MQGNFFKNLENSDCAHRKIFEKCPCSLENPVSMSMQALKYFKNLQAVFKEVQ